MRRVPRPSNSIRSLPAELLLVAVTISTLLSGYRLFSDGSFLAPLAGSALLCHLLVAVVRRTGGGISRGAVISLIGVAALQIWVHYPATTLYGLPRRATFAAASSDLSGAWDVLRTSEVPVVAHTGLMVAAAAAAWLIPLLADWAAFRVGVRAEALAPAGIVFVLIAVFGTTDGRILYPALSVICAVAFGLAHQRSQSVPRTGAKDPVRRRLRRPRGLLAGTLAVTCGVLLTAGLLPTLSDGPLRTLIEPDGATETGGRKVVLSPLVALPGQLLLNPEQELFTVVSSQRSYWRLTALGDFDGSVWSLDETTAAATGPLANPAPTDAPVAEVTQTYSIGALAAVWLPAAYRPTAVEPAGDAFEASFEPVSSTLLVGTGRDHSDGLRYTVHSSLPRFEVDFLASLRNDPSEIPPGFLELPGGLNPALGEMAREATTGHEGPYEQSLALQNWFRDGFEYDLDVAPGHSTARLDSFLLGERRGYCEQFAAAFATLARTLGLPARVAVGFTPGIAVETDAAGNTLYSVRGEHAHAWPEVFIDDAGWVAFEPTPGRGAPGAESYTFVPEQQEPEGPPVTSTVAPPPVSPPPGGGAGPVPTQPDPPPVTDTDGRGGSFGRISELAGLSVAALAAAALVYLLATATLRNLQRRRRRRWAHGDAGRRVIVAWEEIIDMLRPRRIRPRPSETPIEMAQRAAGLLGAAPEAWRRLAFCVSVAAFAGSPMPRELEGRATDTALTISGHLRGTRTLKQRLRGIIDPHPWILLLNAARRGGRPA
jgi:transglutaminase-like putative cysteine protease